MFIDLQDFYGASLQPLKALEAINSPSCEWRYFASSGDFRSIPGCPIAYWASKAQTKAFTQNSNVGSWAEVKQGLATADNDRFLRTLV